MLTPQEVDKKTFAKAMMGGYNLAEVDDFLETVTADYTLLYRENAALKSKMKVLADKVEEYRATEDEIRSTLYAARKKAEVIIREAEEKAGDILSSAEGDASEEIAAIRAGVEEEEKRLTLAKQTMADFVADWQRVCREQEDFLRRLPDLPAAELVDRTARFDAEKTKRFPSITERYERDAASCDGEPTKVFSIPKETESPAGDDGTEDAAEEPYRPAPEKRLRTDEEVIETIRAVMRETTGDDLIEVSADNGKPRPPLIEGEDKEFGDADAFPEDDVRVFNPDELKFGKNRDKRSEE